jgi:hypothetical protein
MRVGLVSVSPQVSFAELWQHLEVVCLLPTLAACVMPMAPQKQRSLNLDETYPCPVCRQGQLQAIVLTEAFACEFCRHILSVDLQEQQVRVVDSSQPLTWLWNGRHWKLSRNNQPDELSALVMGTAIVLTTVPAGLIWLSGALFPPLQPSSQLSFSEIWALITLLAHAAFVVWLIGEYYQIPVYIAAKVRILRFRTSRRA